jgi:hypothetical protein
MRIRSSVAKHRLQNRMTTALQSQRDSPAHHKLPNSMSFVRNRWTLRLRCKAGADQQLESPRHEKLPQPPSGPRRPGACELRFGVDPRANVHGCALWLGGCLPKHRAGCLSGPSLVGQMNSWSRIYCPRTFPGGRARRLHSHARKGDTPVADPCLFVAPLSTLGFAAHRMEEDCSFEVARGRDIARQPRSLHELVGRCFSQFEGDRGNEVASAILVGMAHPAAQHYRSGLSRCSFCRHSRRRRAIRKKQC